MRILLIEDNLIIASFIKKALMEDGYVVDHVTDGKEGLDLARLNDDSYEIIILDIIVPSIDGITICKTLRAENISTPILMLSGRTQTEDKVEGLNAGADDYLAKPFEFSELVARIKAIQRRKEGLTREVIKVRNIEINPESNEVRVEGELINLTKTEFRLLWLLMKNRGKLVSRAMIQEKVWDMRGSELYSNSIDVHIKDLRKKLKSNPKDPLIVTVRGVGYKFVTV